MMNEKDLTKPYPTYEDCCRLWERYNTPPHVIRHCEAVSRTAVLIGAELNRCGYELDLSLLAAAGWLHDMMRLKEDHGVRAAEELRRLGCDAVADVIRVHMRYQLDPEKPRVTETDLLCFADRLVKEDRYVGLDERMEYIIEKSRQYHDPEAEPRIRRSFQRTKVFQKKIEDVIGKKLTDIDHMMD